MIANLGREDTLRVLLNKSFALMCSSNDVIGMWKGEVSPAYTRYLRPSIKCKASLWMHSQSCCACWVWIHRDPWMSDMVCPICPTLNCQTSGETLANHCSAIFELQRCPTQCNSGSNRCPERRYSQGFDHHSRLERIRAWIDVNRFKYDGRSVFETHSL